MILGRTTDLVPYSSASNMARAYVEATAKIAEARRLVKEAEAELNTAFNTEGYTWKGKLFEAVVSTGYRSTESVEVEKVWKLKAWNELLDRLGIRKLMSSSRRKEIDAIVSDCHRPENADKLPDLTEETIIDVLMGYASSAEEFLHEAIREEYDFWKCHTPNAELKTNRKSLWKLDRKVIRGFMVEEWSFPRWETSYERRGHLTALDNIFHLLDGKGCIEGCHGPLVDTIHKSQGSGETEYFKFKCYRNRNLHLEFKRLDLLGKFNEICGRNRLPGVDEQ